MAFGNGLGMITVEHLTKRYGSITAIDDLSFEVKRGEIVGFFENERDEEIGVIAAGEVLEFVLEKLGGTIYNKGVRDTKKLIRSRMEDFDVDIEALIV